MNVASGDKEHRAGDAAANGEEFRTKGQIKGIKALSSLKGIYFLLPSSFLSLIEKLAFKTKFKGVHCESPCNLYP